MELYQVKRKDGTVRYKVKRKDGTVRYYDFVSGFQEGFAAVEKKGKWGFINTNGYQICHVKYEFPRIHPKNKYYSLFCNGYAVVGKPKGDFLRFGYINTKGEEVCPLIYNAAWDFHNGLAWVMCDEIKWQLINKEFKTVTKRTYDIPHAFFYGYAVVELDGKFGFINESGEEMCEIKYDYMSCFNENGLAQITIPNTKFDRTYWIDTQGKEYYIRFDSDEIYPLN